MLQFAGRLCTEANPDGASVDLRPNVAHKIEGKRHEHTVFHA